MAKFSVYVPDDLWQKSVMVGRVIHPDTYGGSPSKIVQAAIEDLVNQFEFDVKVKRKDPVRKKKEK